MYRIKLLSFTAIWYIFLRHIFLKQQCHFCFHFRKALIHFPVIICKFWVFNVKLRRIFWFCTWRSISNAIARLNVERGIKMMYFVRVEDSWRFLGRNEQTILYKRKSESYRLEHAFDTTNRHHKHNKIIETGKFTRGWD